MKRLIAKPADFEMTLGECPPGHFLFDKKHIGFKSEYRNQQGNIEAYNESGEFFWGGTNIPEGVKVIPLVFEWVEE